MAEKTVRLLAAAWFLVALAVAGAYRLWRPVCEKTYDRCRERL